MMRPSVQFTDRNMGENVGEDISKNLSCKHSPGVLTAHQKLLDHSKASATDARKTASKREILKTAEATGDLISNKIANKITKISKTSQQNNSETVTNEHDKEIPKEMYISPEER